MDNLSNPLITDDSKQIEEHIRDYSPYKIPPNIDLAKLHGKARRVCTPNDPNSSDPNALNCPCCKLPFENKQFDLKCHPDTLSHLGVCFPIYFSHIKFCFVTLCLVILVAGIPNLVLNLTGSNCETVENSLICKMSFLNLLDAQEDGVPKLRKESIFNVVAVGLMIIAFEICRNRQRKFSNRYRHKYSIANFSLLLSFLPRDFTQEDIQGFIDHCLEKIGKPTAKILKVYYLYQLGEYADAYAQKKTLLTKRNGEPEKYDEYTLKIQELNQQLKEIEHLYGQDTHSNRNSRVIIVLENSQSVRAIRNYFKKKGFYRMSTYLHNYLGLHPLGEDQLYRGAYIKVSKAPEPSDMTWENLNFPSKRKTMRRFLTTVIASILITLGFIMLFLIKKALKEVQQDEAGTDIGPYVSIVISLLSALCVAITNTLLGICIRRFVRYEKHKNYTNFFVSVGRRLTAVFVLNMTITTILANAAHYSDAVNWESFLKLSVTGLLYDVFFLFITNSYMSSIFNYFDIMWGLKLYKRRKAIKSGADCKLTQIEAHSLFEGHPVDLALRYANVNKTLIFTGLFAPFIPVGLMFSLIGFVIVYWIDKYLLLRRYVAAHKLGYSLPKVMLNTAEWFIVAYSLGNMLIFIMPLTEDGFVKFQTKVLGTYFYLSLSAFLFALFYKLFVPANFIHSRFVKLRQPKTDDSFESIKDQLPELFDSFHPLCRKQNGYEPDTEEEESEKIDVNEHSRTTPATSVRQSTIEKGNSNILL